MTSTTTHAGNGAAPSWHAGFLRMVPAIQRHACSLFRDFARDERDEAVAEVTAVAMMDYLEHVEGAAPGSFDPATLATAASLHVRHSELACGRQSSRDVLSPGAQHRGGFQVEHLKESCVSERLRMRIDLRENHVPARAAGAGRAPNQRLCRPSDVALVLSERNER